MASQKYGVLPNFVEENMWQVENFCKIYDFYRSVRVQKMPKDTNVTTSDKTIKNVKN